MRGDIYSEPSNCSPCMLSYVQVSDNERSGGDGEYKQSAESVAASLTRHSFMLPSSAYEEPTGRLFEPAHPDRLQACTLTSL